MKNEYRLILGVISVLVSMLGYIILYAVNDELGAVVSTIILFHIGMYFLKKYQEVLKSEEVRGKEFKPLSEDVLMYSLYQWNREIVRSAVMAYLSEIEAEMKFYGVDKNRMVLSDEANGIISGLAIAKTHLKLKFPVFFEDDEECGGE